MSSQKKGGKGRKDRTQESDELLFQNEFGFLLETQIDFQSFHLLICKMQVISAAWIC